jgi:cation diffusion facilitator CzcD-associated flavoprotein CzcO
MQDQDLDVLVVGAGISGIGAAVHLKTLCPDKRFLVLERRERFGGTWDLFRYPGIRSDSDMYTLGFRFKPWTARKAIADGPAIRDYLGETIREHDLDRMIHYGQRVLRADWEGKRARWTLEVEEVASGKTVHFSAAMLFMCSGYYDYDAGYTPDFPGLSDFEGTVVHPQHWPEDLDCRGKRVVVIGSGATAVTLVPALAEADAEQVTMLQRTPTYMVSRPSEDAFALWLRRVLPTGLAYAITRWRNILTQQFFYSFMRWRPRAAARRLIDMVGDMLPAGYDLKTHFTPPYKPWDQRLCLVPDSDFFRAIRRGRASVATGHIARFTRGGIALESGEELPADVIVTATGLNVRVFGGVEFGIDGTPFVPAKHVLHKGTMLSDVPNLLMWFGYTNASWTLKADLTAEYACRLIQRMDASGARIVVPRLQGRRIPLTDFVDFSSSYFRRVMDRLPKQGTQFPWRLHQNYLKDVFLLRHGRLDDGALSFE